MASLGNGKSRGKFGTIVVGSINLKGTNQYFRGILSTITAYVHNALRKRMVIENLNNDRPDEFLNGDNQNPHTITQLS
jgi:hypothetical protein